MITKHNPETRLPVGTDLRQLNPKIALAAFLTCGVAGSGVRSGNWSHLVCGILRLGDHLLRDHHRARFSQTEKRHDSQKGHAHTRTHTLSHVPQKITRGHWTHDCRHGTAPNFVRSPNDVEFCVLTRNIRCTCQNSSAFEFTRAFPLPPSLEC